MKKALLIIILALITSLNAEYLILDIFHTNDMHGAIDRAEATFMNPRFPPRLGVVHLLLRI